MIGLPRIGVRRNMTPGLNDDLGPYANDFDGWALIIEWGRFVAEYVVGRRAK